jgi:hypothetical protein
MRRERWLDRFGSQPVVLPPGQAQQRARWDLLVRFGRKKHRIETQRGKGAKEETRRRHCVSFVCIAATLHLCDKFFFFPEECREKIATSKPVSDGESVSTLVWQFALADTSGYKARNFGQFAVSD